MITSESKMHNPAPVAIEHPELVANRCCSVSYPVVVLLQSSASCQPVASHCGRSERT